MGLTDEQQIYGLSDYYLLIMLGDNEICGLVNKQTHDLVDIKMLTDCGFYFEKIDFDELLFQAHQILQDEELI